MRLLRLLRVELGRLLWHPVTWAALALTLCAPFLGYGMYPIISPVTKGAAYLANPTLAGGLCGAVLFGMLTIYTLDRAHRSGTAVLTDTMQSPLRLSLCRTLAVLAAAVLVTALCALVYLPYTVYQMKQFFSLSLYLSCFGLLMLPTILFGILLAASGYQIFRRVDVASVVLLACMAVNLNARFSDHYMLRWVTPLIPVLTDNFSNASLLRMTVYSRLAWLAVFLGIWLLSLLCVRRYQKNIFFSLWRNSKCGLALLLVCALLGAGGLAYAKQPFLDNSSLEFSMESFESDKSVTLSAMNTDIVLNAKRGTLQGQAQYTLSATSGVLYAQVNPGYTILTAQFNGKDIPFTDLQNDTNNQKQICFTLPVGEAGVLCLTFSGAPQLWNAGRQFLSGYDISEDFIHLGSRALMPRILCDTQELDYTLNLTLPSGLTLVAMGDRPALLSQNGDGSSTYRLHSDTDSMRIFAADYAMERFETSGMCIEFYYARSHKPVLEQYGIHDLMLNVIDYCAAHYGPLPFDTDSPLLIVQDTAFSVGGGANGNMSFMTEFIFTEEYLSNADLGANGAEVLAHELIHQWWGLTWMLHDFSDETGLSEWSSEGITCYTTYRLMCELYGQEYATKHYIDVWQAAVDSMNRSFYHRYPEYLDRLPDAYRYNITSGDYGTRLYSQMPLMFVKAAQLLGGEQALDDILAALFQNTELPMYPYMTYDDFLLATGLTREDLHLD